MDHFDLIIIGGGAGAFAAAIRANEFQAPIAIINSGLPLGGTCVNVGCVPSKTLLWAAELLHTARYHKVPGIEFDIRRFDFAEVVRNEMALVQRLRDEKYSKVLQQLEHVKLIEGRATFMGSNTVEVNGRQINGERFIIATGSTASVPPIRGIHEAGFITHIDALSLQAAPKRLAILGAGPQGLEFGQMFSRFGTQVTILHRGPSIFRRGEPELSDRLTEILTGEGITVRTGVTVTGARRGRGGKVVEYSVGGGTEEVIVDEILLAAGKTANTQELGLGQAGINIDGRQAIVVDQFYQTSQPHIFAVGDVANLPLRLETTAGREGTLAAKNALGGTKKAIDYFSVPYAIFTDPQLAGVGFTEEEQMRNLGTCACKTISFADVPKAIIIGRTEGLIKMAVHPKTGQIMGVHILAPQAGELIAEAMMLVKNNNTINDVLNSLPMFPTLSEAIKLAALSFTKDITKLSCCI